jgi:very-short-patch-repair endonuclease
MVMKRPVFGCAATPKEKDLVLIGVVKRKVDLEHLRKDLWYRIPGNISFQRSPRYLAVYPTAGCGSGGGGISFYSTIREITRSRRIELLPEEDLHPRAEECYWKLHLGPPRRLTRRIENRLRRRITFAYTTRKKLLQAHEIGELFGIPPLEEIMRRSLLKAKITTTPQFCVMCRKICRYRIDFAIFCRKGKIALECDHSRWHQRPARKKKDRERDRWLKRRGWMIIHLTENNIINNPVEAIELIDNQIGIMGGLSSPE